MKKADMKGFRKLLLVKRQDLHDRVREARSSETEGSNKDAPDLGDRAISSTSRDLLYRLSTTERDILQRIDLALERIDEKTYGVCTNCGNTVQPLRLEAVPWARHCIECQELQDRGEL